MGAVDSRNALIPNIDRVAEHCKTAIERDSAESDDGDIEPDDDLVPR